MHGGVKDDSAVGVAQVDHRAPMIEARIPARDALRRSHPCSKVGRGEGRSGTDRKEGRRGTADRHRKMMPKKENMVKSRDLTLAPSFPRDLVVRVPCVSYHPRQTGTFVGFSHHNLSTYHQALSCRPVTGSGAGDAVLDEDGKKLKASPAVSAPNAAATTGDIGDVNAYAATRLRHKSPERSKTARANMEPTRHATCAPGTHTSGAASHVASRSRASGTGLSIAQVGTLAQFTVHTTSEEGGQPMTERGGGGSRLNLTVRIRGRASLKDSQPTSTRVKVIDRGNGSFMCEYKPWCAPRL